MRLFVVRHGNTFEAGEPPRRIGAQTDLPLTAAGIAQAEALGRHFQASNIRFARVLSSNLKRTRGTAEAILALQPAPLPIAFAGFLAEIDHGPDENRPEEEVVARLGKAALTRWDVELVPPDGWDVGAEWRIPAWRSFAAEARTMASDADILLVTSNGAARFALSAFGLDVGHGQNGMKLRTGSYGTISVRTAGMFELLDWDRRPGESPGLKG